MQIEIKEIDNGFILTLYDDSAPAETDETLYIPTMKETLDKIVLYYEAILAWRKSDATEEELE